MPNDHRPMTNDKSPMTKAPHLLAALLSLCLLPSAFCSSPILSPKKGVGLAERHGLGAAQLEALGVAWYYNWGSETKLQTAAEFVPMIFSVRRLDNPVTGAIVLGYNEPDHPKQARMTVAEALDGWPRVVAKAPRVGSPAMAGNPVRSEWLEQFLAASPKVDFLTVHWYKGADAKRFIRDMEEIHAKFGLPIWVTEYAPQGVTSAREEPDKYSQADVERFIAETTQWMERTPWIERYAWHCSKAGTSALFDPSGSLTKTGQAWANTPAGERAPETGKEEGN